VGSVPNATGFLLCCYQHGISEKGYPEKGNVKVMTKFLWQIILFVTKIMVASSRTFWL